MTVQELITLLQKCNPNDEVKISAHYTFNTAGPSPTIDVKSISQGFDWNRGQVLIFPEGHLVQLNDYQYNIFRTEINEHDRIRYQIYKGEKPNGIIPPMFSPREQNKE